ncbi:LAMI_0G11936g1_1 [Lachancea mirantina]|uniref:LAMI_0G11936g1_1 n=1 Tax=Lachancea mirantina TaxID=1230905 RepID=A0A1G4KB84_9SACH|nr:LAMI_0G11936g1_1 [Lachancea mirantina]
MDAQGSTRVAYIRIDNLPPGKTWRQVKYFVGGIVHHSNILQVKMLPPVQSIVPPFMPFQSCIVSLRRSDSQLNKLLLELNGFSWEYYRLVAYAVPPLHSTNGGVAGPEQPSAMMMRMAPMGNMYFGPFQQDNLTLQLPQPSKRIKQVFSEESFRKQMTARGMWQLLLEGFPPYLHFESETYGGARAVSPQDPRQLPVIDVKTSHPEKYGKLKWTVLKDFIKLKCHKLLELESVGGAANTREFYVGVYEAQEVLAKLHPGDSEGGAVAEKIGPSSDQETDGGKGISAQAEPGLETLENGDSEDDHSLDPLVNSLAGLNVNTSPSELPATIYKAIVGFHSRELCDLCRSSLQGQEYSLGYTLNVKELPPYDW